MEFVRTAYDVVHDAKGDTVMEDVTDGAGHKVVDRHGEIVQRPVHLDGGAEVYASTESFKRVEPKRLAEALKSFTHVEKIEHTAGGPVVVRVRKGA
jgi:hypothetical protein